MTIVRFPYLDTLNNKADFLYATTNVGILSTSEMGIGITASAAATLRPLFRRFLGRSEPCSLSIELSRPWPSRPMRAGYVRSQEGVASLADEEQIRVTTVVRIQGHSTEGQRDTFPDVGTGKVAEVSSGTVAGKWHTSKLEDASSEEYRSASDWNVES